MTERYIHIWAGCHPPYNNQTQTGDWNCCLNCYELLAPRSYLVVFGIYHCTWITCTFQFSNYYFNLIYNVDINKLNSNQIDDSWWHEFIRILVQSQNFITGFRTSLHPCNLYAAKMVDGQLNRAKLVSLI